LAPLAIALLHEAKSLTPLNAATDAATLASSIKCVPLQVEALAGLERAISTAGGIAWDALDGFMLKRVPGVYVAGEMLDWEAPTGGYLLQGCFATAAAAAAQITDALATPSRAAKCEPDLSS